jgi:hypothetical protein
MPESYFALGGQREPSFRRKSPVEDRECCEAQKLILEKSNQGYTGVS